jgi:streptogramin lyase
LPAGIKPYPIPTPGPGSDEGITVGPDNNLWITERDADKVARLNTAGSFLNTYNVPTANAGPNNITRGPDGNLWFTETNVGHVAKVTPTGTFTEYSSGITPGANPYGITRGPDGNLWFTEFFADKIGRITTSGTVTEFTYTGGTNPGFSHIVTGPDNNLWFTEPFQSRIGRITTGGTITHFAAPGSNPGWIVVGPDNNLWFTEGDAKIVRMNTSGTVTGTFAVPNGSDPYGLAVGADGNLWFVDRFANFVGRITTAGVVTGEFTIPAPGLTNPGGAVSGPDGNIWFLGATSPDVWQVVLDKPLTPTPRTVTPTEGSEFTGVVASFTDADATAAAGDFTARIDWGNGNVTAGVVTSNGLGGFNVTGTNTYTEEGTDAITVTITDINDSKDVGGSTAVAHSTANVADAALSAVPITSMFPVGTEGFPITNLVLANFVDGGGAEPFANYTVTINWGDGTLPTAGTLTRTGLIFSVAGSHTYAEEDPRTIQVTMKDEGGSMATVSVPITLYEAGLSPTAVPVTATEGATFSGVVATFTDSGGAEVVGDYGASINWGDNTAPTSGTITVSAGTFTVRGTHTYAEEGFYTISMSIQHEASGTGLFIVPANVADAGLAATGVAVTATEGGLVNPPVATFTDVGGPEVATNYNALIDWGDGHTSSGLVTFSAGVFRVTGLNAYGEEGMYTVTVTIRDEGGSMATATSTATVADAPLSATAVTFTTAVATEGFAFSNLTLAYFLDGGGL